MKTHLFLLTTLFAACSASAMNVNCYSGETVIFNSYRVSNVYGGSSGSPLQVYELQDPNNPNSEHLVATIYNAACVVRN